MFKLACPNLFSPESIAVSHLWCCRRFSLLHTFPHDWQTNAYHRRMIIYKRCFISGYSLT